MFFFHRKITREYSRLPAPSVAFTRAHNSYSGNTWRWNITTLNPLFPHLYLNADQDPLFHPLLWQLQAVPSKPLSLTCLPPRSLPPYPLSVGMQGSPFSLSFLTMTDPCSKYISLFDGSPKYCSVNPRKDIDAVAVWHQPMASNLCDVMGCQLFSHSLVNSHKTCYKKWSAL